MPLKVAILPAPIPEAAAPYPRYLLKPVSCTVCGIKITGLRPGAGLTCSALCRETAYREKRRRKERNKAARERARKLADPAHQAWRADVEKRKRERQEHRERAAQRRLERLMLPSPPPMLQRQCRVCSKEYETNNCRSICCSSECTEAYKKIASRQWHEQTDPEYKRHLWEQQRRSKRRKPGFYERERERHMKPVAIVRALQELGWVDDRLEIIVPDAPAVSVLDSGELQRRLYRARARERWRLAHLWRWPALPGQIVVVDRAAVADVVVVNPADMRRGEYRSARAKLRRKRRRYYLPPTHQREPDDPKERRRLAERIRYQKIRAIAAALDEIAPEAPPFGQAANATTLDGKPAASPATCSDQRRSASAFCGM